MNLLQIGELAGKFSDAYVQKTKPQMDWRAIKNMRNMFAHDYGSMDKDRIWQTATEDVSALKAYCERALIETFKRIFRQAELSTQRRLFYHMTCP